MQATITNLSSKDQGTGGGSTNPNILIEQLFDPLKRDTSLAELSARRESIPDLARLLWGAPGVVATLLLEVISIFPFLIPPTLSSQSSTRVCNALALMQCIASCPETKSFFLKAQLTNYLYPCLNSSHKSRPFEYLRLTCLGVIGALVKHDSQEVIESLLSTEIVPLCLRIMESGNELSKTVAIFIIQKILLDDVGLDHICQTYERFFAVVNVLNSMTMQQVEQKSLRILKHIIRCYLRICDNKKALEGLRQLLPEPLKRGLFDSVIKEDAFTTQIYFELIETINKDL